MDRYGEAIDKPVYVGSLDATMIDQQPKAIRPKKIIPDNIWCIFEMSPLISVIC